MTTISKKFDPTSLPKWAQNDPQVVIGCKHSLSFRCDVFDADTDQRKRQLKREAQRFQEDIDLNDPANTIMTA